MTIQWSAKYDPSIPQMIYPYTEPMTSAGKDNRHPQPQPTNYKAKAEKEGVSLGETTAHTSDEIKCLFWPKNE